MKHIILFFCHKSNVLYYLNKSKYDVLSFSQPILELEVFLLSFYRLFQSSYHVVIQGVNYPLAYWVTSTLLSLFQKFTQIQL